MTVTVDTSATAPSEPGLTAGQVLARAEAFVPELVERQAEAEERTFYAEDLHERFRQAGFYRILVPRRYGGYEFGVETYLRVSMTLVRGCSSTGWMYSLGAGHALMAASLFDEPAQARLFEAGDFICPGTVVPCGTAVPAGNDGWRIDGTWPYCSGSPYANFFMGNAMLPRGNGQPPDTLFFVAGRDQWTRLDDWGQQLGLRGSGSHSIRMSDGYVPADLAMPNVRLAEHDVTGGTPGRALHGNPEYGGGLLSFINFINAAMAVGMARGALDAYEDLLRHRTTLVPPIVPRSENQDYQFWYGEALGTVDAAEAALLNAVHQWRAACTQGPAAVTRELDLRLAAICRHVAQLCWTAVESHILPNAGSSAVRHGERLGRIWRDLSMLRGHAGLSVLLPTVAVRELARRRLATPAT